jgi:hypothetical protein
MPEIAIVGKKKLPTVLAFPLTDATNHDPTLLGFMVRNFEARQGTKGEGQEAGRRGKNRLKWAIWEEDAAGRKLHVQTANSMTVSGRR